MQKSVIVACLFLAGSASAHAQDVAAGEQSFKKCLPCHRIGPDAKNLVGPVLNGLDGRKAGTVEGYSYTDANKNSGLAWDEATFKTISRIHAPKFPIPR